MGDLIELTPQEKQRFMYYCEQQARSYQGLVDQMEKIPAGKLAAAPFRQKVMSFVLVSRHLRDGEEVHVE